MMETGLLIIDEKEYVEQLLDIVAECGYEILGSQLIDCQTIDSVSSPILSRIVAGSSQRRDGSKGIASKLTELQEYQSRGHRMVIGEEYLVVDFDDYRVNKRGEEVHLTPTEYKILITMLQSPNRIFNREQLITYALDGQFEGYDRSIDTYIKSIRKKIEPNRHKPRYIKTVHGLGYKFVP